MKNLKDLKLPRLKLSDMKIQKRLLLGFIIGAIFIALCGGLGILGILSSSGSLNSFAIVLILITIVGILSLISIYFSIVKTISKPVEELIEAATQFAEGNLDVNITFRSQNELGQLADAFRFAMQSLRYAINEITNKLVKIAEGDLSLKPLKGYAGDYAPIATAVNTILDSLNGTFKNVLTSSEQISNGSSQVASGAQNLAQGATEQASAIQELSATISDVSQRVNENTEHVTEATSYIEETTKQVQHSNQQMQQMLEAMNNINISSNEISKIIKVIDNIAFQTNILALNAAVEAARAGAAGKGFSVVADEVRNLASKSADAAKQTTQLIENSIEKVTDGTQIADSTAQALNMAAEQMANVQDTIRKIEQASTAQATAISEITKGIEQVSAVVQTNSATAEESAAASEELSAQAKILRSEAEKVKLRA
ncbi:methyl-accepting chemotaxis protein [Caproiciproducens galactitolivorans]|uniref:methyl-accepting chemotaxis protein n=1 Tax=Caproiciproducens galactitolivorans TaxID=642589 RepID=UPI00240A35D5|nr:methyl-accepting chemotaxis protein [Caproiciproducens galactitolivorans]